MEKKRRIWDELSIRTDSLVVQTVKDPPAVWETWVWSLHWEDPLKEAWQHTPVLLPGESCGQRNLAGYSLWGRTESDTTDRLSTAQQYLITELRVLGSVELLILCDHTVEQDYENGLLFDKDLPQRSFFPKQRHAILLGQCFLLRPVLNQFLHCNDLPPVGTKSIGKPWTKDQVTWFLLEISYSSVL